MGYVYRPKLKGSGRPRPAGVRRCPDPKHGTEDECSTCRARFTRIWWAKYYENGIAIRESTEFEDRKKAEDFLKGKESRIALGLPVLPRADRIRYEEAVKDLVDHYRATGSRNLEDTWYIFAHLKRFFRTKRIAMIGPADITRYVAKRQADGAANGTIGRELGVLSRMLRLAAENGKLLRVPIIRKPKAAPPREGFFERHQFEAIKRRLRADLQVVVSIQYAYGWRCQSEVLTLKRTQVDLNACTIRLEPGTTKNDDGRLVYLTPELVELLQAQNERVQLLEMDLGKSVPWLFPYLSGKRRKGTRKQEFKKTWRNACLEATLDLEGLEGEARTRRRNEMQEAVMAGEKPGLVRMLRHDFRRSAVRNLVNRGVPERVAMKITGHKTRSVFDRYHIVSPADLQDAARKLTGTFSGTVAKKDQGARLEPPDSYGGRCWDRTSDLRRVKTAL